MLLSDLPQVLEIQEKSYQEIVPESDECLKAKLLASPQTCFVCCDDKDIIAGYIFSIPIVRRDLPALNAPTASVPKNADCLYLHDMAVSPTHRGAGVGKFLYAAIRQTFHTSGYAYVSLIAIQNSVAYWQKYGFIPVDADQALALKLATYGTNARYMELTEASAKLAQQNQQEQHKQ